MIKKEFLKNPNEALEQAIEKGHQEYYFLNHEKMKNLNNIEIEDFFGFLKENVNVFSSEKNISFEETFSVFLTYVAQRKTKEKGKNVYQDFFEIYPKILNLFEKNIEFLKEEKMFSLISIYMENFFKSPTILNENNIFLSKKYDNTTEKEKNSFYTALFGVIYLEFGNYNDNDQTEFQKEIYSIFLKMPSIFFTENHYQNYDDYIEKVRATKEDDYFDTEDTHRIKFHDFFNECKNVNEKYKMKFELKESEKIETTKKTNVQFRF